MPEEEVIGRSMRAGRRGGGRAASIAAALALVAAAPSPSPLLAAQSKAQTPVEQCVADHVAGQEAGLQSGLLEARSRFRACAQPRCPEVVAKACTDLLRELEPRIPSIVPVVRDERGDDVVDGALTLDGEAVPLAAWGRAREVDPGAHELTLERGGQVISRRSVVVSEGEKNRRIELKVAAAEAADSPVDPLRVAGWIGVGLGAAAVAGAVGFWGAASAEHADLEMTCAPRCEDAAVSGAKTKALVGDVLLGGGLALAAAGSILILLPRPQAGAQQAAIPYFQLNGRGASLGLVIKAF